jgi:hypothetical protein
MQDDIVKGRYQTFAGNSAEREKILPDRIVLYHLSPNWFMMMRKQSIN